MKLNIFCLLKKKPDGQTVTGRMAITKMVPIVMVCNEKHKQTNTNKKCNHKYVQNEINIPGLSVMLDAISQIFQCSGFVIQRPFPPLWKKPIPSLCAAADVRWLEGLCSLTVGTDYQKRDTTYKGQISIRIRSGIRNIGKPGLSGNLEKQGNTCTGHYIQRTKKHIEIDH